MKKKIGVLFCAVIMVVGLVACGNSDIMEGTWELTKGISGEMEVTADQLQEAGIGGTTFTFKDGEVTIKSSATNEESKGTYKVEGSNVTITSEGENGTVKGTVENNQLSITDESSSVELVFEKK